MASSRPKATWVIRGSHTSDPLKMPDSQVLCPQQLAHNRHPLLFIKIFKKEISMKKFCKEKPCSLCQCPNVLHVNPKYHCIITTSKRQEQEKEQPFPWDEKARLLVLAIQNLSSCPPAPLFAQRVHKGAGALQNLLTLRRHSNASHDHFPVALRNPTVISSH